MKKFLATLLALAMSLSTVSVLATEDTAVELPAATTTQLDVSEIPGAPELTFAMNFLAGEISAAQLEAYGDWYADFVLKVNKDVTFNADETADGYLAGEYGDYGWIKVPDGEDVEVLANEPLRIMKTAAELAVNPALKITCNDVYNFVNDFDCGVYFTDEFVVANPDLKATLELRLFNNEDEDESYVIGDIYEFEITLPTATTEQLDVDEILDPELTFAMNFTADNATDAQMAVYGDWYADFVLTVNKDVTFNADETADGYLAGEYGDYGWIEVPDGEDLAVSANTPLRIMKTAAELAENPALKITCNDVYNFVNDFNCGVYFTDEFLLANPDLKATLELRLFNNKNEDESYVIGETYGFEALPTATTKEIDVDELDNIDLTFAMNFLADEATDAQLTLYGDWYADFVLTVNRDVTFNADETADGYLAGQYNTFGPDWLKVPDGEDVEVLANEPLRIMAKAAELAENSALKITCNDVYNFVNDFDCGVYFSDDFLDENPGLKATLELRFYNNEDETKSYLIGETYSFEVPEPEDSRPSSGMGGSPVVYCTVKFDTDGGSTVANQKVTKNSKITEPKAPTKEGYIFGGWYTNRQCIEEYDFSAYVTSSFTLYAKWVAEDKEEDKKDEEVNTDFAFSDISETAWYYDDVKYVVENGLMNGVSETDFAPDALLTRAMLVTILYRNAGEPAVNRSIPFADIDLGSYYANAVIWAEQNGIVNGYSDTEFAPNDNITREQIAAIILRYSEYKGYDVSIGEDVQLANFDDFGAVHKYAISAIKYAIGLGVINGKTDRTINPRDNATRAEIAAILHRFIESNN